EGRTVRALFPKADFRLLGHGYPELAEHLDGTRSLEDARGSIVRQVRQYARRQLTWFRADAQVQWIPPDAGEALSRVRLGMMKKTRVDSESQWCARARLPDVPRSQGAG